MTTQTTMYVCPQCRRSDDLVAAFHEHVEYPIGLIGEEGGEPVILELGDPTILGDVYSQSDGLYCNACEQSLTLDELVYA